MNKQQLLSYLNTEPLLIERRWLKTLIDAISGLDSNLSPQIWTNLTNQSIHTNAPSLEFDHSGYINNLSTNEFIWDGGHTVDMNGNYSALLIEDKNGEEVQAIIKGNAAVVALKGPIFSQPNILTEWLGIGVVLPRFMADMKAMMEEDQVERIIMDVNSPGGSVDGISEASEMLHAWGKEKEIVSYVGGTNASAAYWLTTSAGKIYSDKTSRHGSIGVLATYYNYDDENEIEIVSSKSPKKNPDPKTEEGKKEIRKTLDSIADVFIGSVAQYRGVTEDKVETDFGKGGVLVGQDAVDIGMIDGIKSMDNLLSEYSTDTNYNLQTKGDLIMELTLAVLKEKYPQTYEAACKEAITPLSEQLKKKDTEISELNATISSLKQDVEARNTENATLAERVTSLERNEEIRKAQDSERQLRAEVDVISTKILSASNLPERLHEKVKTICGYEQFVNAEGVLDKDSYTTALKNEIKEWEASLAPSKTEIGGITSFSKEDQVGAEDGEVVDRMLSHCGVTN